MTADFEAQQWPTGCGVLMMWPDIDAVLMMVPPRCWGDHGLRRSLCGEEDTVDVGVLDALELLQRHVQQALEGDDPGVAHRDVDPAQLVVDSVQHVGHQSSGRATSQAMGTAVPPPATISAATSCSGS